MTPDHKKSDLILNQIALRNDALLIIPTRCREPHLNYF